MLLIASTPISPAERMLFVLLCLRSESGIASLLYFQGRIRVGFYLLFRVVYRFDSKYLD